MHIDNHNRFYEDTLFVIVIYNCAVTQSLAYQSLCKTGKSQTPKDIFLYDNSLHSQIIPSQTEKIHYYHNPHNAGVSAAYNEASVKAKSLNKKWLLLLDQDTCFDEGTLEEYVRAIVCYPEANVFAPYVRSNNKTLSPFRLVCGKGIRTRSRQPGIHFFRPVYVINSGLLIALASFEAVGGYNELFPLDFSDVVFIERLHAVEKQFVLIDTTLVHSLSSETDMHNTTTFVLDRFEKFCETAKLLKKTSNKNIILSLILLPRAIKLTLMKKDTRFLFLAVRTLVSSR